MLVTSIAPGLAPRFCGVRHLTTSARGCLSTDGTIDDDTSLAALVEQYIRTRLPEKVRERAAWRALPRDVALTRSAYGRDPRGAKHPHQFRLTDEALSAAVGLALERCEQLFSADDFASILAIAREIQGRVFGLGPMWGYDFAERLGSHLEIGPVGVVYLQRGALVGARNLNLRVMGGRLSHSDLPEELRVLDAGDVEDFLCINKVRLNPTMWRR